MTAKKTAALPKPKPRDPEAFLLPRNLEAEVACLGAAIVSKHAADYLVDAVRPEAFFRRAHQQIFEALKALRERQVAVDFVTLKQQLAAVGKLEDIGGASYIAALADGVPLSVNVEYYAGILRDLHLKRAIVAYANQTIDLVAEGAHGASEILVDSDRRLMDLQGGHTEGRMHALSSTSAALSSDLEWRVGHQGELTGVDTGYASINEITLGWQIGDLIIIAARPSIGKTTFVLNSAVLAAQGVNRAGNPRRVGIFSLEMRRRQLEYRILAQLSGIPLTRILGGHLGDPDYAKIAPALCLMHDLRIEIDDRAGQSFWDIRAACRRLKADGGLDLAIVDYVQLMPGSSDRRHASRNEEVTEISRNLKALADEVSVPMIVLSQLSREGEKRQDPKPKLSDLRESGALEQDADLVAFLHRKHHREGGVTNFILEKQRNGPTGTVNLTLDRDITTFVDGGEEPAAPPAEEKKPKTVSLFHRRRS